MRHSLATLALCLSAAALQAQDFTNAIGLRFGFPASVSFKHFLDDANAVEAFVGLRGYGSYRSTSIGGAYLRHESLRIDDPDLAPLRWYYGAGASLHFWSYNRAFRDLNDDFASTSLGISGYIGLQYAFDGIPLELTLDARPTIFLGNVAFNSFGIGYGGLGARYILGR